MLLVLSFNPLFGQKSGTYYAALRIPKKLQPQFGKHMGAIKEKLPQRYEYRFNKLEDLHVTLFYYGELSREKRDEVRKSLRWAAQHYGTFTLQYRGLDVFNFRNGAPRVLWARCLGRPLALKNLGHLIAGKAKKLDFPPPSFPFRPHVTLLRAPFPKAGEAIASTIELNTERPVFGDHHVTEFVLLRSGTRFDKLGPTIIERFKLSDFSN